MDGRLSGRTALVTGAARGIGRAIAERLAAEGARVIASDLAVSESAELALDVACEESWLAAAEHVQVEHGALDILVNNAGIEDVRPTAEATLADWRRVMAVNADGVFLGCRMMFGLLRSASEIGRAGAIVNISSIAGIVGYPNQAAYNASKAAVRQLSKSLAIEWAGVPIRVNCVHPGCIRTPMLDYAVDGWVREGALPADDPWAAVAALCPLDMVGAPEDIAAGVAYLASEDARFVTGAELVIDGGWVAQ